MDYGLWIMNHEYISGIAATWNVRRPDGSDPLLQPPDSFDLLMA